MVTAIREGELVIKDDINKKAELIVELDGGETITLNSGEVSAKIKTDN